MLHAHFRMNGDWELAETAAPLPRFARAAIDLDDATSLVFVDSRALGTIDLHPAGVELDLGLGPDAADPEWTAAQLADELARRRGPIKPALLDQRLVAGLGNIYAAESLWRARIESFAPCNAIHARSVAALRKAIDAVLRARPDRATPTTTPSPSTSTIARDCPVAAVETPIERAVQAGRSTYFCPTCQPRDAPSASRSATRASASGARFGCARSAQSSASSNAPFM